jgi:hypothetical protein
MNARAAPPLQPDLSTMKADGGSDAYVLIVHADDAAGATVLRAIAEESYRPRLVANAQLARVLLDDGLAPCVVLFALRTPDDGRDFIRAHLANPDTAAIPVIFFAADGTSATGGEIIVPALLAFVRTYCHRPPAVVDTVH